MTIEIQFISLISMLFTGVYLGCMFDTNEQVNKFIKNKRILSVTFQFLFWLAQSLLIFLFLVKVNGGHVRLYFVLAIVIGYQFYFLMFRNTYQVILAKVIELIIKIYSLIKRFCTLFIIKPILFIVQVFLSVLNLAIMGIFKLVYFFLKLLEWILRPVFKVIPKNVRKYLVSFIKVYSKIVDRW